jgi:glycosyltransferase involved in cell wall biosynthesis
VTIDRSYARGVAYAAIDAAKSWWSRDVGRVVGAAAPPPRTSRWARARRDVIYRLEDLAEGLTVTDEWLAFVPAGVRAGLRALAAAPHDVIYVCGDPNSAYLTGWILARRTGLPLVLDMRDPWTLDPTIRKLKRRGTLRIEEALERRIFRDAARIVLNTERARAQHVAAFPSLPAARFACVHNAFDAELVSPLRERPAGGAPLTVAHFGNYHRLRSARVFLDGLARIAAVRPVRFVNHGEFRPDDLAHARALGLGDAVELGGYVPYADGPRALSRAHVLLLKQRNDESVQIPGKFYDYLLARRPILSLSRNPELAAALSATGAGFEVDPSSPAAVAEGLARLGAEDLDRFEARFDGGAAARFSAETTTAAMAAILDDARRGARHSGGSRAAGGAGTPSIAASVGATRNVDTVAPGASEVPGANPAPTAITGTSRS